MENPLVLIARQILNLCFRAISSEYGESTAKWARNKFLKLALLI